jgi:regulatory protein
MSPDDAADRDAVQTEAGFHAGLVTAIETQKKAGDRVSVFVEGRFSFGMHAEILLHRPVRVGDRLSEADIDALLREDAFYRARSRAYRLLAYRPRSRSEVEQRLAAAGYGSEVVARVMHRLEELDLIDDAAFAADYAAARVRSKGYGPARVRNELARKGIATDEIENALDKAYGTASPSELALAAGRKIAARLDAIEDARKRRKRLIAYLSRRGFSFDEMKDAIEELLR